jgi:hypothetical protein
VAPELSAEQPDTVSKVETEFRESSADFKVEALPLSHVSVELGHLYMEDFVNGEGAVRRTFAAVAPWARVAHTPEAIGCAKKSARVSTCFLIDDYFSQFSSPAKVIPMVLAAAEKEGLKIDYLAREAACATADGISPASLTLGSLVTEPVPGTTGGRPPLTETGWLTNGQRSPSLSLGEAMTKRSAWQPPRESARRRHSIFVDVELWDEGNDDENGRHRTWSCPMLAAVWQLMRLGLLRDQGRPVVTPRDWKDQEFPDSWDELPPVIRLNSRATAFAAYTTLSVLSPRFLPVELAVRTILSQFTCDEGLLAGVADRAERDAMQLPAELVDRVRYVFATPGDTDPA